MTEKTFETQCGIIHYWISKDAEVSKPSLVFLPGLTADHRLFNKQIECFEGKYPVFVWDAPGHAASWVRVPRSSHGWVCLAAKRD